MQERNILEKIKLDINKVITEFESKIRDLSARLDFERLEEMANCIRYTAYRKLLRYVINDCADITVSLEILRSKMTKILKNTNCRNIYYQIITKKRDVITVPLDDNTAPIQHWDDFSDSHYKYDLLYRALANVSPECALVVIEGWEIGNNSPLYKYIREFKSEYNRLRVEFSHKH